MSRADKYKIKMIDGNSERTIMSADSLEALAEQLVEKTGPGEDWIDRLEASYWWLREQDDDRG